MFCSLLPLFVFCLCSLSLSRMSAPAKKETPKKKQLVSLGWDGNSFSCQRFLSDEDVDPHSTCRQCRIAKYGRPCDSENTCYQCKDLTAAQWAIIYARSYAARKKSCTPKKTVTPSKVLPKTPGKTTVKSEKETPARKPLPRIPKMAPLDTSGVSALPEVRRGLSYRAPDDDLGETGNLGGSPGDDVFDPKAGNLRG